VSEQGDRGHTKAPLIVAPPSPTREATQGGGWPTSRDGGPGERDPPHRRRGRTFGEAGGGMDDVDWDWGGRALTR
jgi:hypothetical protein